MDYDKDIMSIIRSPRPERGFTIVSNDVAQDARLSMRALGLLVRLLSRPDNWETNSETLAREFGVGRDQMQGVLRELSSFGYMSLVKHRHPDGKISSRWHVFDEPETSKPEPGKPAPGNPYAGKHSAIKKNLDNKEPIQSMASLREALFDRFWKAYPKKVGKDAAQRAFDKRKPDADLTDKMVETVETWKKTSEWMHENGKFIPNPATWLNQGRWKDGEGEAASTMPDWMRAAI